MLTPTLDDGRIGIRKLRCHSAKCPIHTVIFLLIVVWTTVLWLCINMRPLTSLRWLPSCSGNLLCSFHRAIVRCPVESINSMLSMGDSVLFSVICTNNIHLRQCWSFSHVGMTSLYLYTAPDANNMVCFWNLDYENQLLWHIYGIVVQIIILIAKLYKTFLKH